MIVEQIDFKIQNIRLELAARNAGRAIARSINAYAIEDHTRGELWQEEATVWLSRVRALQSGFPLMHLARVDAREEVEDSIDQNRVTDFQETD
jgi:hypothetical protein